MSEEKRKFQGVWIPADMWLDRSLSITEKVMLVEINSLESDDRGCYKSNSEFAEFFGLSSSRISEIISGLAQKGLVAVELIRDGKRVVSGLPVEPTRRNSRSHSCFLPYRNGGTEWGYLALPNRLLRRADNG